MIRQPILYSAIYQNYDVPKVQPTGLGCRQVMFTDDPTLRCEGWEIHVEPLSWIPSPMLRAKWWKALPPGRSGEIWLWIDASMTIRHDDYAERAVAALGDADALFYAHPTRACIYSEAEASATMEKYRGQDVLGQVEHYRTMGHPEDWGLFAAGATVRRLTPAVRLLGRRWWQENRRWTFQDQLSLPYLVRRMSDRLQWNTWGKDVPWQAEWSIEHP